MFRYLVLLVCVLSVAKALPVGQQSESTSEVKQREQDELEEYQNQNAQYEFNSEVNDNINDNQLQRSETRDGTKVTGKYSYSDGFVRRTVNYVADENGYRVVSEQTEEIGNGPVFNPEGQADVYGSLIGGYSIKLDRTDDEKHYKDVNA